MAQPQMLDFRLIAADFRGIRVAAGNLVERQRHQRIEPIPGAEELLQGLYRATANTLQAALFLCEERESDLTRERRFAVAVPPLVPSGAISCSSIAWCRMTAGLGGVSTFQSSQDRR